MKKLLKSILVLLILAQAAFAQDVTTVEAKDTDISDNLDLEAVASLFGECENIEDFEKRLNDPETQISNLDLNEDGEVDYLRVVENSKDGTYLITLQAVLEDDLYQDVATIDVEKDDKGETQVQVVGDVYMYGPDYIIEPVYVHPPVVVIWFWGPYYSPWRSPYYWGYYPPYYHPWHPYPTYRYQRNVHVHINVNNSYRHTTVRRSTTSVELQNKSRRNDYGTKNPDKSFTKRNEGVKNREDLNRQRGTTNTRNVKSNNTRQSTGTKQSTGKPVQKDWSPSSDKNKGNTQVKSTKGSVSSGNSNTKTGNNKSNNKSTRPSNNQQSNNKSTNTRESKNQRSNNNVSSNKTNTRQSGTQKSNSKGSNRSERKSKKR